MPRNNALVAKNRWKRVRERDMAVIAASRSLLVERAALCGFLAGDGSIVHHFNNGIPRCSVSFYPDDEVMRDTYLSLVKTLYNKTPTVRVKKKFFEIRFAHLSCAQDIVSMGAFGIKRWRPPAFVFASAELMCAWLRAFFSAEGHVGKNTVRIQTVNAEGMQAVSRMLTDLCIAHRLHVYHPPKQTYSAVHILIIQRRDARERYAQLIGFWHSKKTEKLTLALKTPSKSVSP